MNPAAFHAHTGTDRVDVGIVRSDRNLGPNARFSGGRHDGDDALADLRHFGAEQVDQEVGMRSRQQHLGTAGLVQDVQHQRANSVPAPVALLGDLLADRHHRFGVTEVDDNVAPVDPLNDAVQNFSLAVDKIGEDGIFLGVFHLLNDDLFGGLSGDAPEVVGIHFGAEAVADFAFGIELAALLQADLQCRLGDDIDDVLELKHFDFAGIVVVMDFDIDFIAELLSCG